MRTGTFAFLLGICLLWQLPALPAPGWLLLLPPLAALAWRFRPARPALAFALGLAYAGLNAAWSLRFSLEPAVENRPLALVGAITELPRVARGRASFVLRLESLGGTAIPRWRQPLVRLSGAWPEAQPPRAGERWRLQARLRAPHAVLNPGGEDGERWLFEQGLRAVGSVLKQPAPERLDAASGWTVAAWREDLRGRMAEALAGRSLAPLVVALVLGDDAAVPEAVWDVYRKTGTAHLVAISGSHITLVAGFLFLPAYFLWRRSARLCLWLPAKVAASSLALGFAFLYSLMAGFGVPVQRALLMLLVLSLALSQRRRLAWSAAYCAALLAVLLLDAKAVLSPGFWLSFGAVAAILWLAEGRAREEGWRIWLRLQLGLGLALVPLSLLLFQRASVVGPLANLVAVPWFGFVGMPLALSGCLLLPVWPWAGTGLLRLAEASLAWLHPVLATAAAWPGASWALSGVGSLAALAASLGLLWLLAPRGFPARGFGLLLLLPALSAAWRAPEATAPLRLTVVDVGQGLAALVETRSHVLVFDAGYGEDGGYSAGARQVAPLLRELGYREMDRLVVSHGDADHAGGAAGLLAQMPARAVLSSVPERYAGAEACEAGRSWTWDGVRFDVLHPDSPEWRGNDGSCVLKVSLGEQAVLLTGDIEAKAERALLARYGTGLRASVLLMPHHGSASSSTPDFLAAVAPAWAIAPVGYGNRFRFPRDQVLARYARHGIPVLRTDRDGAVSIAFSGEGPPSVTRHRELAPRIWRHRPDGMGPASLPAGPADMVKLLPF